MTQQRIHKNRIELFTDSKDTAIAIQKEFSAFEEGYKHNIRYRSGQWDGKQKFYDVIKSKDGWIFYISEGFKGRVEKFTGEKFPAKKKDYTDEINFLKEMQKELPFKPYKHQLKIFLGMANEKNHLGIASVGSGKSLVIYLLTRYKRLQNKKVLILVPTVDLVNQLKDDFVDYRAPEKFMGSIQQIGGEFKDKDIKQPVVISTWQSAQKSNLSSFDVVINDETHLSKADVLQHILSKPNFEQRLGLTGTMPIIEIDALLLEKQFGQPKTYITAKELIELGLATDLVVVPIFLNQKVKMMNYQDEVKFMKQDKKRREWLTKFLHKLTGLSIALYAHTEHGVDTWESYTGIKLDNKMKNDFERQKELGCFFMTGSTNAKTRKKILEYLSTLDNDSNVVLIGQQKILSTGINIKALKNLIFLSSSKSFTQIIQSVGRVLRLHESKTKAVIFDLVDNYSDHRTSENYSLIHFYQRLTFYQNQGFEIVEMEVPLK